jgi:hypothetical protein
MESNVQLNHNFEDNIVNSQNDEVNNFENFEPPISKLNIVKIEDTEDRY